jgi:two-component system response regulator YesN
MFKANPSAENSQIDQKRPMDRRINQALKFIDKNIENKLALKSLCRTYNLSAVYFSGLFKKEIGVCFSKYLTQLRIDKSKVLLKESSLSIKEVSYAVGYRNVSNFDHDFGKSVGLSPREYRRQTKK